MSDSSYYAGDIIEGLNDDKINLREEACKMISALTGAPYTPSGACMCLFKMLG